MARSQRKTFLQLKTFAAATLLVTAVFTVDFSAPAAAAIANCGTSANEQVGWGSQFYNGTQPELVEGSSSYIITRTAALCTTDKNGGTNFSTAWNMVYAGQGYAQAGTMYRYGASCIYAWSEQSLNGTFTDYNSGCTGAGATHAYRNLFVITNGVYHIQSSVDGKNIHTTSWDPLSYWTVPYQVAFTGETWYSASDVPGTSGAKTNFTAMGVQRFSDNSLVTSCGNVALAAYKYAGASRYSTNDTSCSYVSVWTN